MICSSVVRFQHKYFVPIAVFSGLVLPTLIAKYGWGDAMGGYVWGGLVARLLIWHTTFCINSLAHWTGLQPYTEEVTARGNYVGPVEAAGVWDDTDRGLYLGGVDSCWPC